MSNTMKLCMLRKDSREFDALGWCQLPAGHDGNCDADAMPLRENIPTDPALDTGCDGCQ